MTSSMRSRPLSVQLPAPPTEILRAISAERARRHAERELERVRREADVVRANCGSLIGFVREFWHVLEPRRELVEGWPLEAMCLHLEAVTDGRLTRLLENVPPGFMKSLLVNVFWPAWEWGPCGLSSMRYVAFSYSAGLTERDNGKFRDLILSAKYQALWGDEFALRTVGVTKIENDRTGWKLASSIGGVGTGERGDRVLLDDPHNVKEAESDTVRTATVTWFVEAMSNRLNDLDESAIVVIMQRVHEADVAGEILSSDMGYAHLMIPWDYDPGRHCETAIGWSDPRRRADEPAWPARFSAEAMAKFRARHFMWSSQYQQAPVPRGGGILKADYWREWNTDKVGGRLTTELVVASLDSAYTEKRENDESALTVWAVVRREPTDKPTGVWIDGVLHAIPGETDASIVLIDAWEDWLEFDALLTRVNETCTRRKVDRLLIEPKANGKSIAQEVRRVYAQARWGVVEPPVSGDKVARAHSVQHLFEDGLIYAPCVEDDGYVRFRSWAQLVIDRCASFPKGARKGLVDSTTQALRHLRDIGILLRQDEVQHERRERTKFRQRPAPLYPT